MEFYSSLTKSGVFFFWIIIFLVVLLLVLSIILYQKNKKLKLLIENKSLSPLEENKEEIDTLENIEIKEENIEIEKTEKTDTLKEEKPESNYAGAYQKNVLREMSKKMPVSPIHIEKSDINEDIDIYTVSSEEINEVDKIAKDEDYACPLEEMEDSYEVNDGMKFAREIVSKMEEEIKPSNIELTDYEKKQEEEAIISYDELQKVKEKIYNITDDEETEDFIDELKNFRVDLQ